MIPEPTMAVADDHHRLHPERPGLRPPPIWHEHPSAARMPGVPSRDFHRYVVESRAYLKDWVHHALSEVNRDYRLRKLGAAVGLGPQFLERYLAGESSIGHGLLEVMNEWAGAHVDIGANNPTDDVTMFAELGDLG